MIERPELRDRLRVFGTRADAGRALAGLMPEEPAPDRVLAIPAGGVPVAAALVAAWRHGRAPALDVLVVSKITLPWNTEVGIGAVAEDGTVRLNEGAIAAFGLGRAEVAAGVSRTRDKVLRRARLLRSGRAAADIAGQAVVLVDDGLASGMTMLVAAEAARHAGAGRVEVAVPTAHVETARRVSGVVDRVICANLRSGPAFAVADAYEEWYDVPDDEIIRLLGRSA